MTEAKTVPAVEAKADPPVAASARVICTGHLDSGRTVMTVSSSTDEMLRCFTCDDDAVKNYAWAWWNPDEDDLLCDACYKRLHKKTTLEEAKCRTAAGYKRVLTLLQ